MQSEGRESILCYETRKAPCRQKFALGCRELAFEMPDTEKTEFGTRNAHGSWGCKQVRLTFGSPTVDLS